MAFKALPYCTRYRITVPKLTLGRPGAVPTLSRVLSRYLSYCGQWVTVSYRSRYFTQPPKRTSSPLCARSFFCNYSTGKRKYCRTFVINLSLASLSPSSPPSVPCAFVGCCPKPPDLPFRSLPAIAPEHQSEHIQWMSPYHHHKTKLGYTTASNTDGKKRRWETDTPWALRDTRDIRDSKVVRCSSGGATQTYRHSIASFDIVTDLRLDLCFRPSFEPAEVYSCCSHTARDIGAPSR